MISIIMIVYEVEQYVSQSVRSVLDQTYRDFELIIVAGYGSDRSVEICSEYAKKDSRIKLITCEAKGIADARNRGIAAASGDYLGFVDSDDYIEPGMYERMLSEATEYEADMVVCGRFYEYENTTLCDTAKPPVVLSAKEAIEVTLGHDGFFLHLWDKLYSRRIYEGLTFRTDITVEDRIVVDTLLAKADRVVYDPTPMYHFRERSGSNSKRSGMIRNNIEADVLMEEFVKKEYPELSAKCDTFMLYEFITALQNEMTEEDPDRADIREYKKNIRQRLKQTGGAMPGTLKVKALMAIYMPLLLKVYTKRHQKDAKAKLERFP